MISGIGTADTFGYYYCPRLLLLAIVFYCYLSNYLVFRERKSGESGSRLHASRPEATPMDFVVRPQSKIDPDEIRARAKQMQQDERRMKVISAKLECPRVDVLG